MLRQHFIFEIVATGVLHAPRSAYSTVHGLPRSRPRAVQRDHELTVRTKFDSHQQQNVTQKRYFYDNLGYPWYRLAVYQLKRAYEHIIRKAELETQVKLLSHADRGDE